MILFYYSEVLLPKTVKGSLCTAQEVSMCNGSIFYLGVSSTWEHLLSNHKIKEKKQNPRTRDELVIYGCKMPRDTIDLALASARALYNEITVPCLHLKLALWISISFTYIK